MDSYTIDQLRRIEEKLDLIIENTDIQLKESSSEDKNQEYFPWYQDLKSSKATT
jgi:hypothetical protein